MASVGRSREGAWATVGLVVATVFWGSTFVVVKDAIASVPPFEFLAIRFAVATLALWLFWRPRVRHLLGPAPLLVGGALAAAFGLQTWGLVYTGATNAAFITGLYVVFTPLLGAVLLRRLPGVRIVVAVALATAGLGLLTLRASVGFTLGDLLVLLCAAAWAVQIVLLGRFAPTSDVRTLAVGQLAVATMIFAALVPTDALVAPSGTGVWFAVGLTALGATAFGFAVQTWAQRHLSANRTAVVLTMEPVFGAVFGIAIAGERLGPVRWLGAALILTAIGVTELRASLRRPGHARSRLSSCDDADTGRADPT